MTVLAVVPNPLGLPANTAVALASPGTSRLSRWWSDSAGSILAANPATTDGLGNLPTLYAETGVHSLLLPDGSRLKVEVGPPADFVATGLVADVANIPTAAKIMAAIPSGTLVQIPNGLTAGRLAADVALIDWTTGECFELIAITRDVDDVITTATAKWPDGSAGTFTTVTKNTTWNAIDAFTITHTLSGKTVTQAAMTRNANGAVTVKPALTVA